MVDVCPLGISAFIGEISSGVTTVVFNFLILGLAGNNGVAAFGVVANISIMAISVFNGIAQGAQPLFSRFYGKGDWESVKRIWKLSVRTAVILAVMVVMITNIFTESIVGIFNSENNVQMANYAMQGVRIYFVGFLFAGCNIVGAGYLSATENAGKAFGVSIMRGVVAIIACAVILAYIFGMPGVWLAFPMAECITTIFLVAAMKKMSYRQEN